MAVLLPVVVVLALLLVLLRLTGRSDFKFRARGFGVSVNLVSEDEARDTLNCTKSKENALE